MNSIAMLDIILFIIMLIFTVRCILQGFIKEILSMTSWLCAILGAILLYKQATDFMRSKFFQQAIPILPELLAFSAVFFIIFLVVKVFEVLIKDILKSIDLGGMDRFMGLLLGIIEGLVCMIVILFIINIQPIFEKQPIFEGSVLAGLFLPLIEGYVPSIHEGL